MSKFSKSSILSGVTFLIATFGMSSTPLANSQFLQQGYDQYQQQEFATALDSYQQANRTVETHQALMGIGSAAYRLDQSMLAVEAFKQAAVIAKSSSDRAQALFNLGNSYLQLNANDYAVEAYQQALLYQPDLSAAQHNLALAQQQQAMQQRQLQRQGRNGEGERGDQGQGAGEREGKLDLSKNYVGGAGEQQDSGDSAEQTRVLPQQRNTPAFSLEVTDSALQVNSLQETLSVVHKKTANRQQAEKFLLELQGKTLHQQRLLKRLIEREAGFYADQTQPHEIPGVDPW